MFQILKWFFGIIITLILVYILIVIIRIFFTVGFTDNSNIYNFSLSNWLKNFNPNIGSVNIMTPGEIIRAESNYVNTYFENLSKSYYTGGEESSFSTSWADQVNSMSFFSNTNSNVQANTEYEAVPNSDLIKPSLSENSSIKNNQVITGLADYRVFSNKTFLVYVLDANKKIVGKNLAYSNGNINGNKFIPFRAVLDFVNPETTNGYILFKNLQSNIESQNSIDASVILPIHFKQELSNKNIKMPVMLFPSPTYKGIKSNEKCVVTGCSSQLCVTESEAGNLVSTCEWRQQYSCYINAFCDRDQQTGQCGWIMDKNLSICLQNNR